MKIMYRVTYWNASIKPIEISNETGKTLVIAKSGCRELKMAQEYAWFETPQEAYKHLSDFAQSKMLAAENAAKLAQAYIEQVAKLAPACTK